MVTPRTRNWLPGEEDRELDEKKALAMVKQRLKEVRDSKFRTSFPVNAFPERIQNIITCFHDCYRLPVDYHCTSILVAASVAIGNAFAAKYKNRQVYPPILYTAVVGFPSSGKSPGIDFGTYPITEIEKRYRRDYRDSMERWKEAAFKASVSGDKEPPRPKSQDILINDATVEAINATLQNNPKGLLMYQDELKGWVNSMNTYRKGSDLEYWLSVWSGKPSKVSRTGRDSMFIPHPFVSVIGGIQPGVLQSLANDGKADNGFLARILFAYPDEMRAPEETFQEPDETVFELYEGIITWINNLPNDIEIGEGDALPSVNRIEVPLSQKAKEIYIAFLNEYTREMNESDSEAIKGILGKLKQYCLRLSLVLEFLEMACQAAPGPNDTMGWDQVDIEYVRKMAIGSESMERAIAMITYFRRSAFKVVERLDSPIKRLGNYVEIWYESLPEEFEKKFAIELAEKMNKQHEECNLSERHLSRILNNEKGPFFHKVRRGLYQKMYL